MAQIGDRQFSIMCNMWGVDKAIEAAKEMGMAPSKEQIEECRRIEEELNTIMHDILAALKEEE